MKKMKMNQLSILTVSFFVTILTQKVNFSFNELSLDNKSNSNSFQNNTQQNTTQLLSELSQENFTSFKNEPQILKKIQSTDKQLSEKKQLSNKNLSLDKRQNLKKGKLKEKQYKQKADYSQLLGSIFNVNSLSQYDQAKNISSKPVQNEKSLLQNSSSIKINKSQIQKLEQSYNQSSYILKVSKNGYNSLQLTFHKPPTVSQLASLKVLQNSLNVALQNIYDTSKLRSQSKQLSPAQNQTCIMQQHEIIGAIMDLQHKLQSLLPSQNNSLYLPQNASKNKNYLNTVNQSFPQTKINVEPKNKRTNLQKEESIGATVLQVQNLIN